VRALGAAKANLGGAMRQGGSTITMQVARNFFLTREKFYGRKLNEVMLALKIEAALSKDQILELYMNQIYLGQRSFGFGSAAQTYFGKSLKDLSIAEMAMLAGLPQNPARHNPAVNPKRAKQRQQWCCAPCATDYITEEQYQKALRTRCTSATAVRTSTSTPNTWPNWRARWCTPSSRKTPTPRASASTPRS
jgi:penicillin-binding protein 1A